MFLNRREAGKRLAFAVRDDIAKDAVVLALPRGGVPVADEVARVLGCELDVLVVRKLGAPKSPEFAFGAVGEGGVRVVHDDVVTALGLSSREIDEIASSQQHEVERRVALYRGVRPMAKVQGRTVIVVDDGLATGATAAAAVAVLRHLQAGRIVLAVPTGSREAVKDLRTLADDVICLEQPEWFQAVGLQYQDFGQTSDQEVLEILAAAHLGQAGTDPGTRMRDFDVVIPVAAGCDLAGRLTIPAHALGVVVFAHGSGSSRWSPRNQAVARTLNERGIGTLLIDLLTMTEADDRAMVFDIDTLVTRLVAVVHWVADHDDCRQLPIGLFGASTGAAGAIGAAALEPALVKAVVSRGGRPDLAQDWLGQLVAPTLLIVGGDDTRVLAWNRQAAAAMHCPHQVAIVPGATHLFEEPGTLAVAAQMAGDWFVRWLKLSS